MPVTEKEAAAAVPPEGWVRRYTIHGIKQTTAPLVYHIGVGLTVLAATCPLNYGMHFAGNLRANNFCLLVGRSGEDRKSSALGVGRRILDQAAPSLVGDFPGSPEGLIDSLEESPSQMIPISEFGKFLSAAQRGYFEPTKTLLADLWDCVDSSTDILGESGWKGIGEVEVGDRVWALDPETDELVLTPALAVGSRPLRADERMVTLRGHNHDIRTTEGHRYYIKYRDPQLNYGPSPRYLVKLGREMVKRKSSFYLPFSGTPTREPSGVDLTDDELRFVAWSITDSTLPWSENPEVRDRCHLSLHQSEHKSLDHIRALLCRLGIDRTEHEAKAGKTYNQTSPNWTLKIPKGTGKGSKKRSGWFPFRKYMDKDLAPGLMEMTQHQFKVFWHELLLADGEQVGESTKGLLWSTRKLFIDRLQHLAVLLGFSTQYGDRLLPSGKTAYRMSVTNKQHVVTDPGNEKSLRFQFDAALPNERVWCATTKYGTLVTRRNGKVVILGNSEPIQRSKANRKVVRIDQPRLSIAAACSIPYLEKHTLAEDWTGGFMGRWMVLYGRRERTDPDPVGDRTDEPWLVEELRRRASITSAGWCQGLDAPSKLIWTAWFHNMMGRQLPSNIVGIRARAPTMARKVALLYGWDYGLATLGQPWLITPDILEPAIAFIELHVKSLVHLSEVIAEHPDARLRRSVLQAIDEKGGLATLGEILSILKMRKRPVTETLDGLIEEGKVQRIQVSLAGSFAYQLVNVIL